METRQSNPLSLVIVAALFFLAGLGAIWSILEGLTRLHIDFNFAALGVLIGPGLLRHKRVARTVALLVLWIVMIAIPATIVAAMVHRTGGLALTINGMTLRDGPARPWMLAAFVVEAAELFVLAAWQYTVLVRPDVRWLFRVRGAPPAVSNPMPWRLRVLMTIVVLAIVALNVAGGIALKSITSTPAFDFYGVSPHEDRWSGATRWRNDSVAETRPAEDAEFEVIVQGRYHGEPIGRFQVTLHMSIIRQEHDSPLVGLTMVDQSAFPDERFGISSQTEIMDRQLLMKVGLVSPRSKAMNWVIWPGQPGSLGGFNFPTVVPASPTLLFSLVWFEGVDSVRPAWSSSVPKEIGGTAEQPPPNMFPGLSEEVEWDLQIVPHDPAHRSMHWRTGDKSWQ